MVRKTKKKRMWEDKFAFQKSGKSGEQFLRKLNFYIVGIIKLYLVPRTMYNNKYKALGNQMKFNGLCQSAYTPKHLLWL